MSTRPEKCPVGHVGSIRKLGFSFTRTGAKQRWQCTKCGRTFFFAPPHKPAVKKARKSKEG